MSRREPFSCQRDRATFYKKLLALGYPPQRANDISLKLSKDIYSYRQGKVYDATGRNVVVELPSDLQGEVVDPGDRSAEKLRRTKNQLLELAAR